MMMDDLLQYLNIRLSKYITDISVNKTAESFKYSLYTGKGYIEIQYFFIDDFYRIRIECSNSEGVYNVLFLTKSKAFHKEIKKRIRKNKLKKKRFEDHIVCFVDLLEQFLEKNYNLDCMDNIYIANLRFDGLFI
ncbi:MAG: hypothetical protein IJW02_01690 [Clostridia bacterium]|nr:hypothetical protein [Clostridia bacterium]